MFVETVRLRSTGLRLGGVRARSFFGFALFDGSGRLRRRPWTICLNPTR